MQAMPNVTEIKDWVTLVAAVVAAVASIINLRAKDDRIKVVFGPMHPPISPGEWLYVVSQRDHQMRIRDFGFIDAKGRLLSLPQLYTDEPEEAGVPVHGTGSFDKLGDILEYGPVVLRDKQIGAYAITAGQSVYRIGFHHDVAWITRLKLRLKILFKQDFQQRAEDL